MKDLIRHHLSQLEGDPGISLEDLKGNFRRLSFIWHPDRHPDEYRLLTEEKLQKINEAFAFFQKNPEALGEDVLNTEEEKEPDSPLRYEVVSVRCVRCDGSSEVSVDVDPLGRFISQTCPVCQGQSRILIDRRNNCRDCKGEGVRPHLHETDQEHWIETEMRKRGWIERNFNPVAYQRTWLRYQKEIAQCSSCSGAGHFYYRPDLRKGQRRSSSPLDYLQSIQGTEHRQNDRRKTNPA
jgi:hypothetical protein